MWIVGGVIFTVYMYFTIWNITRNNSKKEETDVVGEYNAADIIDMDGMGNFSRFPKKVG